MPKGAPGSRGGPILPRRLGSKGGEGKKSHEGPKILVVLIPWGLESKTVIERSNERCSALFWQLGAWTLPSEGADGWLMRGITIPQYEFALKKRGGGMYLRDTISMTCIPEAELLNECKCTIPSGQIIYHGQRLSQSSIGKRKGTLKE